MKKLLNTLYVTTQGTYLTKDGECIVVRMGDEVRFKVPVHSLGGVVCFGQVSCSPFLMGSLGACLPCTGDALGTVASRRS